MTLWHRRFPRRHLFKLANLLYNSVMTTLYTFIVDTNLYSGNFEREMCAFITGQIGECGVGRGEASEAEDELPAHILTWFEENIEQRGDDEEYPCMRPCSIVPTPGRVNNGVGGHFDLDSYTGLHRHPAYESVGIFFSAKLPAEVFRIAAARAQTFADNYRDTMRRNKKTMTILNIRLTKGVRKVSEIDTSKLK